MSQSTIPKNCINCGNELDTKGKFCKDCGTSTELMFVSASQMFQIASFCPNCDQHAGASDKFCRFCAGDLSEVLKDSQKQSVIGITQSQSAPSFQSQSIPTNIEPTSATSELSVLKQQEAKPPLSSTSHTLVEQTVNNTDNPASFISPSGAALAVICFFMPWLNISQCGVTKSVSGAEMAIFDGSFWLFPLMGIVSFAAYFMCKNQKQLWKARPFIIISSGFALFLLFYKYNSIPSSPEIMGQRITAADLGFTLGFGVYGTVVGFILTIAGCLFMNH